MIKKVEGYVEIRGSDLIIHRVSPYRHLTAPSKENPDIQLIVDKEQVVGVLSAVSTEHALQVALQIVREASRQ